MFSRISILVTLYFLLIDEYSISKKCLLISIDNRNLNHRITEVGLTSRIGSSYGGSLKLHSKIVFHM